MYNRWRKKTQLIFDSNLEIGMKKNWAFFFFLMHSLAVTPENLYFQLFLFSFHRIVYSPLNSFFM